MASSFRFVGAVMAASAVFAACGGGVQLERTPGVPKYKALPPKTAVQIVDSADILPQPTQVVGTLRADSKKADGRKAVEADFKKDAARYGCDAVVALASQQEDKKALKTVETLGQGGKKVKTQQEVITSVWHWHAQCVRTAAMGVGPTPAGDAAERPAADPKPSPIAAAEGPTTETSDRKPGQL